MSKNEEQDRNTVSTPLQGNSINATNATNTHSPTVDQSSKNERSTKIDSSKKKSAFKFTLVPKNKMLRVWVIPITAGIISAAIWWGIKNTILDDGHSLTPTSFKAGTYIGTDTDLAYTVSGGSNSDGREHWLVKTADKSFSAEWVTGPIEGHPLLMDIEPLYKDKLAPGRTYGRVGTINPKAHNQRFEKWIRNPVVMVNQTEQSLAFRLFINGKPRDTLSITIQK